MVGESLRSRSNRRRKKRKNNRNLMMFLALAFLFFTILLSLIVLNKNDGSEAEQKDAIEEEQDEDQAQSQQNETEKETNETDKDTNETKKDTSKNKEEDNNNADETEEKSEISVTEVEAEDIDDANVLKAYVGDWEPVATKQAGEHTTNYQNGSEDRIEIKRAISDVTDIPEDDMVEWRVENGGEQKVIATVSDNNEEDNYRVYLTWIDNKGWQVSKLEHLKKNDKK